MYSWQQLYDHLRSHGVTVNVRGTTATAYIPNPPRVAGPPERSESIHIHGKGEFPQQTVDKICNNLGIAKMS